MTQALTKVMREAGPSCCNSSTAVSEVLSKAGFDTLTPETVPLTLARVLGMMVSKPAKTLADIQWDFEVFATTVNTHNKNIDWTKVIQALDHPDFRIQDAAGFEFLVIAFKLAEQVKQLEKGKKWDWTPPRETIFWCLLCTHSHRSTYPNIFPC